MQQSPYIDHANKTVTLQYADGTQSTASYDIVALTAGAVTRSFPVPGVAQQAIGLKNIEEAVYIRDRLLNNFDAAAALSPGPARDRLLTVVFVGGGYAGVEAFGELRSLATALLKQYPELTLNDTHFHLIEATGRILPEVDVKTSQWVVRNLAKRHAYVNLNTHVVSAEDGHLVLSDGRSLDTDLLVWTAGVVANPAITRHTDLPVDARGRILTRADLRVGTDQGPVPDAWAAGDDAAVPDLTGTGTGTGTGGTTVPNAQHAVRQGKLLARNLVATLRGREPWPYFHKSIRAVATLGLGIGVFQSGRIVIKGFPAWLMHRGYHALAIPSWERKLRVMAGWANNFWLDRDTVGLQQRVAATEEPRLCSGRRCRR